ncbi:transposase domain-containing protein [Sporolactobacillus sp. THM7-4]|nr:transposase domain-containing protein [Sporolactobacillus sp. THM7-4]
MGRKACKHPERGSFERYSVVETAKENRLNPLKHLTYLFEQLPSMYVQDLSLLDRALPWSEVLQKICHTSIK